ncbi:MAG: hypothetical protein RLZZ414_667 [Bacteroidota bacterium]|jgi:lysophospholipase L1-like esterase
MFKFLYIYFVFLLVLSCSKEKLDNINTTNSLTNNNDSNTVVKPKIKYLALGDSYTIGQGVSINDNYPNQLVNKLIDNGLELDELKIIATTGWSTDDLLQNIYRSSLDSNYNLVSVLIGVNNQFRKIDTSVYKTQLIEIIEQAIVYAGNKSENVIALSIPDYWYTPFGQNYPDKTSDEIDWYNTYKKQICAKYKIKYYNITPISRRGLEEPELVATDNLHPSEKMYALWVNELYKDVLEILKK